jgi:hypothetical protein
LPANFFFFFFFFGQGGSKTQGLTHCRHVLYQWATSPSPKAIFGCSFLLSCSDPYPDYNYLLLPLWKIPFWFSLEVFLYVFIVPVSNFSFSLLVFLFWFLLFCGSFPYLSILRWPFMIKSESLKQIGGKNPYWRLSVDRWGVFPSEFTISTSVWAK